MTFQGKIANYLIDEFHLFIFSGTEVVRTHYYTAEVAYNLRKIVYNKIWLNVYAERRQRGIEVFDLDDATCIKMMADFVRDHPELWNEDIGVEE